MAAGIVAVLVMSVKEVQSALGFSFIIAFPWRIALGTVVTAGVAAMFATSSAKQESYRTYR